MGLFGQRTAGSSPIRSPRSGARHSAETRPRALGLGTHRHGKGQSTPWALRPWRGGVRTEHGTPGTRPGPWGQGRASGVCRAPAVGLSAVTRAELERLLSCPRFLQLKDPMSRGLLAPQSPLTRCSSVCGESGHPGSPMCEELTTVTPENKGALARFLTFVKNKGVNWALWGLSR